MLQFVSPIIAGVLSALMTGALTTRSSTSPLTYSWQSPGDLPAIIAVDLYSGLKGHRLRPSSVTTSPVSLLTREKSAVFWRTRTWNIYVHGSETEHCPTLTPEASTQCLHLKHWWSRSAFSEVWKRFVEKKCKVAWFFHNLIAWIKYFHPFSFSGTDNGIMHR